MSDVDDLAQGTATHDAAVATEAHQVAIELDVPDGLVEDELRQELDRITELPLDERAAAFAAMHTQISDTLEGAGLGN